ncbi:RNA polymerase sigma factor [Actinoplanes couchii]|uniref:RNA polymerase sigma factor n=1 Tax=Actinoplanes couchii TaxID=403638 RepID=UPI001945A942|nr:sigma-70 family RNA polymerase sigma factor [Actinoplanes couchii]MDR6319905.1 RNA polymerase sigma factor (sigma-70 family) [Actinoplanes couchii]
MDESYDLTDLVAAAAGGEELAWQGLVTRFTPLVASVAWGFRLQGTDADDVAQTVWLRLVEHLGKIKEPQALPMWIKTTARNECLRQIRAGQRTQPREQLPETTDGNPANAPDEPMLRRSRQQALLAGLAELPEPQRQLVLLFLTDPPMPYAEISRQLGIPIGSIGPTRARALHRLRTYLQNMGWE